MEVEDEKIEAVFRKVRQVQEHKDLYCLNGDRIPVSIEDLQFAIEDIYGLRIEKRSVKFEANFLRGMCERYGDGRVRVLVRDNQPDTWKRFTAVKEMAHPVIDEKEDWSPRGRETIEKLVTESTMPVDHVADAEVVSEALAQIAAVELLVPYIIRQGDRERIADKKQTLSSLAAHYGVPDAIMMQALSPRYIELCENFWPKILK